MKTIELAGSIKPSETDQKYGYTVGIDGVMKIEEVMEFLSVSRTTVTDRCRAGIYRKVRDRGTVRICRRSVMEHLQSGEVGPEDPPIKMFPRKQQVEEEPEPMDPNRSEDGSVSN